MPKRSFWFRPFRSSGPFVNVVFGLPYYYVLFTILYKYKDGRTYGQTYHVTRSPTSVVDFLPPITRA